MLITHRVSQNRFSLRHLDVISLTAGAILTRCFAYPGLALSVFSVKINYAVWFEPINLQNG